MADWNDLSAYIRRNYIPTSVDDDYFLIPFSVNQGRMQSVFVRLVTNQSGDEWIHIESVIGQLGDLNPVTLLRQIEHYMCGGLGLVGQYVTLRHAVPLADISTAEFEVPLGIVAELADQLEKSVSVRDNY